MKSKTKKKTEWVTNLIILMSAVLFIVQSFNMTLYKITKSCVPSNQLINNESQLLGELEQYFSILYFPF